MVCFHISGILFFPVANEAKADIAVTRLTNAMNASSVHITGEEYVHKHIWSDGAIVVEFSIAFPTSVNRDALKEQVKDVVPFLDTSKRSSIEAHKCRNDESPPPGPCDEITSESWGDQQMIGENYHRRSA